MSRYVAAALIVHAVLVVALVVGACLLLVLVGRVTRRMVGGSR